MLRSDVMELQRSRPLLGLIVGQVCLHASTAGMRMALPVHALDYGSPQLLVGALAALFSVAPIVLAIPAGRLADRAGYHVPARLAALLTAAGAACAALGTLHAALLLPLSCLGALLSGAGCNIGLMTIQRTAGTTARDVTELKQIFSWLGIAPSISHVIGPGGAGFLIDHAGYRVAFGVLAVMPLASLWVARFVPHEPPRAQDASLKRPAWDLLATPMLRRLLVVNWCMSASWDVHAFAVPIFGHERGFSASVIGSVLAAFAISVTAVRLALPVLAHRLGEAQVLRGAMLLAAASFVLYPFTHSVWTMAACACLLGLALGCSHPMVMTTLHQITPAARHGEAIALRSMTISLSSALMPLAFGVLGATLGAAGLFWSMAWLVGGGSLVARQLEIVALEPAEAGPATTELHSAACDSRPAL
jgi:MFS family permease